MVATRLYLQPCFFSKIISEPKDLNISTYFCISTELYGNNKMATITVSIPDSLKAKLDKYPEINWAEVLRSIFAQKVKLLKKFEEENEGEM